MNPGRWFRTILRRLGFDFIRYTPENHPLARRLHLLAHHGIQVLFDIGANEGQYGLQMRQRGFAGRIVSFEPLSQSFARLQRVAAHHPPWEAVNVALGDFEGESEINVSANSLSSSFLTMLPSHEEAMPEARFVGKEKVRVTTLESIIPVHLKSEERLFVKIDAQGLEKRIVEGAHQLLDRVEGIQLEASVVPLYRDDPLLPELLVFMAEKGFTLASLEPGFTHPRSAHMLQVDCIFFRSAGG